MKKQQKNISSLLVLLVVVFFAYRFYFSFGRKTVRFANKFLGENETANNSGFENPEFQKMLSDAGWVKSLAWCVFFVKAIWLKTLPAKHKQTAQKLLTGSSQGTFANFDKDKSNMFSISKDPKIGDIVIWQKYSAFGVPAWQGHAGIVIGVKKDYFETIEGNTNTNGGREGYTVAVKKRAYDYTKINGLRLRGFIRPVL